METTESAWPAAGDAGGDRQGDGGEAEGGIQQRYTLQAGECGVNTAQCVQIPTSTHPFVHIHRLQVARASELFIRAFKLACDTDLKPRIADAVHQDVIRSAMAAVDVDVVLGERSAYAAFKRAYGYRSWCVAPEEGVRGLLRQTLELFAAPLQRSLDEAHAATVAAAEEGMARARVSSGGGAAADEVLRAQLLGAARDVLAGWRAQTWDQLARNLHAEAEFPAPERFAALKARLEALCRRDEAARAARQVAALQLALQASRSAAALAGDDAGGERAASPRAQLPGGVKAPLQAPGWQEFYMGWLDKRSRGGRWQRRWFALSVRQQRMWYFRHPEEQPARAVASLAGAEVTADPEEGGLSFHVVLHASLAELAGGGGGAGRRGSGAHAPPAFTGTRTKTNMMALTLRAATAASKAQWVGMVRQATRTLPTEGPVTVKMESGSHVEGADSPVQRKISTQVFADAAGVGGGAAAARAAPGRASRAAPEAEDVARASKSHGTSAAAQLEEEEEEVDEGVAVARREAAEAALFAEVAAQAGAGPSEAELALLECVTLAVREYAREAAARLAEQASKVVADGMLPLARCDALHEALLRVLVPAGSQ
jgi:hypothetical protein